MLYNQYKCLQQYIDGVAQDVYKKGDLVKTADFDSLEACENDNKNCFYISTQKGSQYINNKAYHYQVSLGIVYTDGTEKWILDKETSSLNNYAVCEDPTNISYIKISSQYNLEHSSGYLGEGKLTNLDLSTYNLKFLKQIFFTGCVHTLDAPFTLVLPPNAELDNLEELLALIQYTTGNNNGSRNIYITNFNSIKTANKLTKLDIPDFQPLNKEFILPKCFYNLKEIDLSTADYNYNINKYNFDTLNATLSLESFSISGKNVEEILASKINLANASPQNNTLYYDIFIDNSDDFTKTTLLDLRGLIYTEDDIRRSIGFSLKGNNPFIIKVKNNFIKNELIENGTIEATNVTWVIG